MENDIRQTTTTELNTKIDNYSVSSGSLDSPEDQKETYWDNQYFDDYLGYYQKIPELKKAIDTFATWVLGQGYNADSLTRVILDNIKGWGEDSFLAVLWNMLVVKKFNGDSYAEIIRSDNKNKTLINLKPLNPKKIRHVVNKKGIIDYYEYTQSNKEKKRFKPDEIFHLSNDRIADQIHGTSVIDCVKWIIDARNEAMSDLRRVAHRSTIRVLYIDEDDKTRLANLKSDYAEVINKGELLILPVNTKDAQFQDLTIPPTQAYLLWIQYLENFFYQAVGVPKAISGGTQDSTEAASKVGMAVFDPIYIREITDLQNDIFNQLGLRIEFTGQNSIMDNMQADQKANTGQTKLEYQGAQ